MPESTPIRDAVTDLLPQQSARVDAASAKDETSSDLVPATQRECFQPRQPHMLGSTCSPIRTYQILYTRGFYLPRDFVDRR